MTLANHYGVYRFLFVMLVVFTEQNGVCKTPILSSYDQKFPSDTYIQDDVVVVGRISRISQHRIVVDTIPASTIKAYGADTIGEVVDRIRVRFRENVSILVNGRRLASTDDINALPPEALTQIEILGPGSAGQHGLPSGNSVINLVLRPKFQFVTFEGGSTATTEGGGDTEDAAIRYTRIRKEQRLNMALAVRRQAGLRQSQRIQNTYADYRSLSPDQKSASLISGFAMPVGTLNLDLSAELSGSRNITSTGPIAASPMAERVQMLDLSMQHRTTRFAQSSITLSGTSSSFFWSILGHGEIGWNSVANIRGRRLTSGLLSAGLLGELPLDNHSRTRQLDLTSTVGGPLFALPAGTVTLDASTAVGLGELTSLIALAGPDKVNSSYKSLRTHAGISIPVVNESMKWLGRIGTMNARQQLDYARFTGSGSTIGSSSTLDWVLISGLLITLTHNTTPNPSNVTQRYAPLENRPGVLIYDAAAERVVAATVVSGGRTDIRSSTASGSNVQASYQTNVGFGSLSTSVSYAVDRISDPLVSLSNPSPLAQRLLPGLFTRNSDGTLTQFDARAFNGRSETTRQISANMHLTGLPPKPPGAAGTAPADKLVTRGPLWPIRTWDLNLGYSYVLSHRLQLYGDAGTLDLLAMPLSLSGMASSRHRLTLQWAAGLNRAGLSGSLTYNSGAHLRSIESDDDKPTHYSSLTRINMEAFLELSRSPDAANPASLRVKIAVDNLLNQRPGVSGYAGLNDAVERFLFDPYGRTIRLTIRKSL